MFKAGSGSPQAPPCMSQESDIIDQDWTCWHSEISISPKYLLGNISSNIQIRSVKVENIVEVE